MKVNKMNAKTKGMEKSGLKQEYVKAIRKQPILFGEVAETLAVTPGSLMRLLTNNHEKLTQIKVLKVLQRNIKGNQDINSFVK